MKVINRLWPRARRFRIRSRSTRSIRSPRPVACWTSSMRWSNCPRALRRACSVVIMPRASLVWCHRVGVSDVLHQGKPSWPPRSVITSCQAIRSKRAEGESHPLQLDLGVAVRLVDRLGGFAEVVKMTELVGHAVECLLHRLADRVLAVGDHPDDWHRQGLLDLAD